LIRWKHLPSTTRAGRAGQHALSGGGAPHLASYWLGRQVHRPLACALDGPAIIHSRRGDPQGPGSDQHRPWSRRAVADDQPALSRSPRNLARYSWSATSSSRGGAPFSPAQTGGLGLTRRVRSFLTSSTTSVYIWLERRDCHFFACADWHAGCRDHKPYRRGTASPAGSSAPTEFAEAHGI
jgi:hypothetical protein